jgi:predicted nuclease of predicted toxin-antitoxin system
MKFKVDENLPVEVAQLLRTASHDATTVGEQHMSGCRDWGIAKAVRDEQRALITLDLDFADMRYHPASEYDGLVVLRLMRQDKPYLLDVVGRLIPLLTSETLDGRLWIVDERRIRIRR